MSGVRVEGSQDFEGKSCGRGAARAEDAQGTPTKSHISPRILVYEDQTCNWFGGSWFRVQERVQDEGGKS